jgi:hypothetical protein
MLQYASRTDITDKKHNGGIVVVISLFDISLDDISFIDTIGI